MNWFFGENIIITSQAWSARLLADPCSRLCKRVQAFDTTKLISKGMATGLGTLLTILCSNAHYSKHTVTYKTFFKSFLKISLCFFTFSLESQFFFKIASNFPQCLSKFHKIFKKV